MPRGRHQVSHWMPYGKREIGRQDGKPQKLTLDATW